MPINIFYHLYIPDNYSSLNWSYIVDEQLSAIVNSKLADNANVYMAITMPMHWISTMSGYKFVKNNPCQVRQGITFEEKVREYINARYSFVEIVDMRDISHTNIYEGQTLKLLYDHCKTLKTNTAICYLHSKGSSSGYGNEAVGCWREILNHYIISEWKHCVTALDSYDVVGIKDLLTSDVTMSGNFWWTTSDYVNTLSDPLESNTWTTDEEKWPQSPLYRYAFEVWIMSNKPNFHYMIDTRTNHYYTYCFLETLLNC